MESPFEATGCASPGAVSGAVPFPRTSTSDVLKQREGRQGKRVLLLGVRLFYITVQDQSQDANVGGTVGIYLVNSYQKCALSK